MVDPIGVKPSNPVDRRVVPIAAGTAAKPATSTLGNDGGDSSAVTLTGIASSLAQQPPVDTDRVAVIRAAIANGTFPLSPARIADQLIALKLDWNSRDAS